MKKTRIIFVAIAIIFLLGQVQAQEDFSYIISNSGDWKDTYSILQYSGFIGKGSSFLVSTRHGPLLWTGISKENDIRVISSEDSPLVLNYDDYLRGQDFRSATEISLESANLELIEELPEIKNFIIVSDTYGYSAIAVAPYAVVSKSWVFLVNEANIEEVDSILSNRDVENVLIYGYLSPEITQTLQKYSPEIIDNEDRFKDNVAIVEKYLEIKPTNQVLLTNGEFIESEIVSGNSPILFTGKENVPDQIRDYIKSSDIEVGVLVGADLVGTATNIRRTTGISVIVKFARGARNPTGAIAAVENLDLYYIPIPVIALDITSARYNTASSQLELTYKSDSNIPVFFKGTITPKSGTAEATRFGDVEAIIIGPNDYKTVSYSDVRFPSGETPSVEIFTLYGDTPSSLEFILEKTLDVSEVDVIDNCQISIEKVKYSIPKESFYIKIKNIGDLDCYVDAEIENIEFEKRERTLSSDGSVQIKAGKSENIVIAQTITESDLQKIKFVDVVAYYGEKQDSLAKTLKARLELSIETISMATIGLIVLAIIIISAIAFFFFIFWKRRKDDDDF